MSKANLESMAAFAKVPRPFKSSCQSHHSSPVVDGKFMIYFQGMKLFIPEDFQSEVLLELLRMMK